MCFDLFFLWTLTGRVQVGEGGEKRKYWKNCRSMLLTFDPFSIKLISIVWAVPLMKTKTVQQATVHTQCIIYAYVCFCVCTCQRGFLQVGFTSRASRRKFWKELFHFIPQSCCKFPLCSGLMQRAAAVALIFRLAPSLTVILLTREMSEGKLRRFSFSLKPRDAVGFQSRFWNYNTHMLPIKRASIYLSIKRLTDGMRRDARL